MGFVLLLVLLVELSPCVRLRREEGAWPVEQQRWCPRCGDEHGFDGVKDGLLSGTDIVGITVGAARM